MVADLPPPLTYSRLTNTQMKITVNFWPKSHTLDLESLSTQCLTFHTQLLANVRCGETPQQYRTVNLNDLSMLRYLLCWCEWFKLGDFLSVCGAELHTIYPKVANKTKTVLHLTTQITCTCIGADHTNGGGKTLYTFPIHPMRLFWSLAAADSSTCAAHQGQCQRSFVN